MLKALRQRRTLSEVLDTEFDITSDKEILLDEAFRAKIDAFLLHTAYLEVTRRHGPSADKGHKTRTLPIALALFLSLELVEAGKIRMSEIFGKNAKYGLPTGIEINSKSGFKDAEKKWDNLIRLYAQHFGKFNGENISAVEELHQKFRERGGDESSNISYTSKTPAWISKSTSSSVSVDEKNPRKLTLR